MVDCSHANSNKDHNKQHGVLTCVGAQIADGNDDITGVMIESHLQPGSQSIDAKGSLKYGVSVTDACVGWTETEAMLRQLYRNLEKRFH